jgi:DNA-binding MarR family transcriptional regulator
MMREARKRVEITKPRCDVLAQLAQSQNGLTFVELSKALQASETNLSRIVDRLVRSDVVIRVPNPWDRRSLIIRLSAAGQAYIKEEQQRHNRNVEKIFKGITQRDLRTVGDVLSKAEAVLLARAQACYPTQNVKREASEQNRQ